MALDRASVLAYLETHSTTQTAQHFHVSDRYIRKLRAVASPAPQLPSSPVLSVKVDSPSQSVAVAAPGAAPVVDWVRLPGKRGLHRVVRTNSLQQQVSTECSPVTPALASSAGVVPVPVPDLNMSSGPVPAFSDASVAVGLHNEQPCSMLPVKSYSTFPSSKVAIRRESPSIMAWFLAASVGPFPLPALLLGLLLIMLARGL